MPSALIHRVFEDTHPWFTKMIRDAIKNGFTRNDIIEIIQWQYPDGLMRVAIEAEIDYLIEEAGHDQ